MAGSTDKAAMRELMRQHREAQGKAKINDPLARYSPAGELFCVLCNTPVKSNLVWTAHVQGRAHKQQLQALRSRSATGSAPASAVGSSSARAPDNRQAPARSVAGDNGASHSAASAQNQNKRKFTALVQDYSDDDDSEDDSAPAEAESSSKRVKVESSTSAASSSATRAAAAPAKASSGLPAGFFDNGVEGSDSVSVPDASSSDAAAAAETATEAADSASVSDTRPIEEKLPEGFFDDKKQDAKARKIEYVDPQVAEYEKFQQAILKANQESEVLMDQDDDEAQDQRHYMELHETLAIAQRVDTLQEVMQRKLLEARTARQAAKEEKMSDESASSDDDDNFDWRAKKVSRKVCKERP
ncbi:zinc finger protein 830-like [Sycon ciliatum]|uniref:zinc finger protein 830-like n=1 Tax=Sycon ciliatum TaxID=27933 RepID=UPI0031F7198C